MPIAQGYGNIYHLTWNHRVRGWKQKKGPNTTDRGFLLTALRNKTRDDLTVKPNNWLICSMENSCYTG